ncbi:cation transporter chac [Fusarium sporotrichioides]|uniref:glutathione-specific gamma-glutamylcyclotransferase n=1 Tax=Fusarium sporotrichioides TaxID=5514 RepID=A0A395RMC0_FUSSP|nr:cation transporter chac [Fusarium sporotrichioides]
MTNQDSSEPSEFWLYGYGYATSFLAPNLSSMHICVNDYLRVAQELDMEASATFCEDHRGTPEAPGRVVTLIERSYWEQLTDHHDSAPERVWGVAYRIIPEKVAEVKEYLDIREINGYTIHYAPFQPADGSPPIRTLVYIGTPDNEQFVGPQDPQKLAEHIFRSQGPSGLNKDYLLSLDTALGELASDSGDVHIHDLARRVRELERNCADENKVVNPTPSAHMQKHSTEEAEEIEEPHH